MTLEQLTQIHIMNWLKTYHPEIEKYTYHFANERKCTPQQGLLLKNMGVKRGVSDIFIAVPRGDKSGLWLELKAGKGRLSKEQRKFLADMREQGYAATWTTGHHDAKQAIINYLTCNFSLHAV